MPARRALLLTLPAALLLAAPAAAAPPNDAPASAAPFEPYTAANGRPRDLQATAELFDATADPGVRRCLGARSFARTAWYRIPAGASTQLVTVEAFGRTLDVVDLAAYVQPPLSAPVTGTANACVGVGAGGADAAEEPTSGIVLRVPPGRDVLVQAGRRGAAGAADDERALLSLETEQLPLRPQPVGDVAGSATPKAASSKATFLPLKDATITEEDPALAPCPSLGTVWRRVVPGKSGTRTISVSGAAASTLSVFRGRVPTAANARDCVNRSGYGPLKLRVKVKRRQPLWVRVGSDSAGGSGALLRVTESRTRVVDGGPGGFDPTPGGAGGGLPSACDRGAAERATIRGPRFRAPAGRATRSNALVLTLRTTGASACDARLTLVGPRKQVFGRARVDRLAGTQRVRFPLIRTLARGRYRVTAEARSQRGGLAPVRTTVRGRVG